MTDLRSVGSAVSNAPEMKLRIIHSILYSIQSKELLALKAKSRFSKEEAGPYFQAIAEEAKKRIDVPEQVLKLDVFLALSKLLKLPAARLNEKGKVVARSAEIERKWFEKAAKKDKTLSARFETSHVTSKMEFMLHYEYVQLLERFLKNEKVNADKEPFQKSLQRYWGQLPEYKKVQILEHLKAPRESSFDELAAEFGTATLLFEMGIRTGLHMYGEILPPIHEDVPNQLPDELWVLHPEALFTADAALKTLLTGSWSFSAAMLLLYMEDGREATADESVLSTEWSTRESAYLLLLRQINELKMDQQKTEEQIAEVQKERAGADSAQARAQAVYENLRERLIVLLKTDAARPYLGDISVSNTRIREKLTRINTKIESNKVNNGVFRVAGAWLSNVYLQNEKNSLEKKLQTSFEKMADEVMDKYPYYEADLIEELAAARTNKNNWQFESERLRKKEAALTKFLSDMKSEELKLREKAAESASKTQGLKQLGTEDVPDGKPIA